MFARRPSIVVGLFLLGLSYPHVSLQAQPRPTTVQTVIRRYVADARRTFEPRCREAGISWPPKRITLLAFKTERTVEVWGANAKGRYHWLGTFPIMAASGIAGPKHYEGDRQVPEGFYRLSQLNPLSQFHLSMRVDYPNAEDIAASPLPRSRMGGDIFMHGNRVSAGCLAMGDSAIEKLFTLVALANPRERRILIAPVDFRRVKDFSKPTDRRVANLYHRLRVALEKYR
jgi:hypothetical protein